MKHYFTNNTDLASQRIDFVYRYQNYDLRFSSDLGVFSKKMIDYGSRVLLDCFDPDSGTSLLDVGCGYGTFGVSLKKVYPYLAVTMVDVNQRALELAKDNCLQNQVKANVFYSDCLDQVTDKYDIIVTNPPIRAGKQTVMKIVDQAFTHLNQGGSFWVVIQKKQGGPSMKKKIDTLFGNCQIVRRDKGYYIFKGIKE